MKKAQPDEEAPSKKASPIKKSPAKSPGKRAKMTVAHADIEFEIVEEQQEDEVVARRGQNMAKTPLREKQPAQLAHETPPSQYDDESSQQASSHRSRGKDQQQSEYDEESYYVEEESEDKENQGHSARSNSDKPATGAKPKQQVFSYNKEQEVVKSDSKKKNPRKAAQGVTKNVMIY